MSASAPPNREGSLEAPSRHPLDWRNPSFYDEAALTKELERVFDICHGCRRCFSLCNAFPTLFDAVDATSSGEVHDLPVRLLRHVVDFARVRSEEHTSELQSQSNLVCRLLLEKKKKQKYKD